MKKKTTVLLFFVLFAGWLSAQITLPTFPQDKFPTYYWQRATLFEILPQDPSDIVFLGDSITDGAEWSELFYTIHVKNRGISGDTTEGVLNRLAQTVAGKPSKLFLLIGVNDLSRGTAPRTIVQNIELIISYIRQESPSTKIFVQSMFPVNDVYGKFGTHTNKGAEILKINQSLQALAGKDGYQYVDVFSALVDENGKMNADYTNDGLHLKGAGYQAWVKVVRPLVYGKN